MSADCDEINDIPRLTFREQRVINYLFDLGTFRGGQIDRLESRSGCSKAKGETGRTDVFVRVRPLVRSMSENRIAMMHRRRREGENERSSSNKSQEVR